MRIVLKNALTNLGYNEILEYNIAVFKLQLSIIQIPALNKIRLHLKYTRNYSLSHASYEPETKYLLIIYKLKTSSDNTINGITKSRGGIIEMHRFFFYYNGTSIFFPSRNTIWCLTIYLMAFLCPRSQLTKSLPL